MGVEQTTIPARRGTAVRLMRGQIVKAINTYGQQVVDTWAFNAHDTHEFMSMEHSRSNLEKLIPRVGDSLATNYRRSILTIVGDTTPGIHDTLMSACDRYRYELLGCTGYHDNCADNLLAAMRELGKEVPRIPCPLNLFMNVSIGNDGSLEIRPPVSKPNQYVALRAEMDVIVVFSACPQDVVPTNGPECRPTDAHLEVE